MTGDSPLVTWEQFSKADVDICEEGHLVIAFFDDDGDVVATCHLDTKAAHELRRKIDENLGKMPSIGKTSGSA